MGLACLRDWEVVWPAGGGKEAERQGSCIAAGGPGGLSYHQHGGGGWGALQAGPQLSGAPGRGLGVGWGAVLLQLPRPGVLLGGQGWEGAFGGVTVPCSG